MLSPEEHQSHCAKLLASLGIDEASFYRFTEWALSEHLVQLLTSACVQSALDFSEPNALLQFRSLVCERTGRRWSHPDLDALFTRVKQASEKHYREPVTYAEYLKLLWNAPLECTNCRRAPPEVTLHVDHIFACSRGGSSKSPNLQFLCATCNTRKGAKRQEDHPWLTLQ